MAPPRAGSATLRWTAIFVAAIASLALVSLGVNLGSGMLGVREQRSAVDASPATAAVVDVDSGSASPGLLAADSGASRLGSSNIAAALFSGSTPQEPAPARPAPGGTTDGGGESPTPAPGPGPVTPPPPPTGPTLGPVLAPLAPILDPLPLDGQEASSEAAEPSDGASIDQLAEALRF